MPLPHDPVKRALEIEALYARLFGWMFRLFRRR